MRKAIINTVKIILAFFAIALSTLAAATPILLALGLAFLLFRACN